MFIPFLHLFLAVFNLFLHLFSHCFQILYILFLIVFLLFNWFNMFFEISNRLIPIFKLPCQRLILKTIFSDALFLREFSCIKAFVSWSQICDFIMDKVQLMQLLLNFLILFFNLGFQISFWILQFRIQIWKWKNFILLFPNLSFKF